MRSTWCRALLVSFVLIMSSLAGCLGNDDEDDGDYGTVMVSTYHIKEIVEAITGDSVKVEMMSTQNIPVHDYQPSLDDIVRLSEADLFFYHGLNLEPWAVGTLDGLGSDAPEFAQVHTMPTGEISLDYEGMLVDTLCESLNAPSASVIHILAEHPEDADELHGDDAAHNLGFPEDDHDEHAEEEHDNHDEEGGHGDHDEHDHGEHEMLMPEDTLTASSDCPAGTTISVYHFEKGEYMLEFEGEDVESFKMAIAQMMGAHHHHHDHGDHGDEDHDDHDEDGEDHDDHDEDGEDHDDHDEEMHAEDVLAMFDSNSDGYLSLEEFMEGMESMEDDHGDHGDDDHGDHADPDVHHGLAVVYPDNTSVIFDMDHDELPENATGWNLTTMAFSENNISLTSSYSTWGNYVSGINGFEAPTDSSWWWELHTWNDSSDSWEASTLGVDSVMIHIDANYLAWAPNSTDDSMIPHPGASLVDDHDEHHDEHDYEHEFEEAFFEHHFNEADADADGLLDMTELETFADTMNNMEDDVEIDLMTEIYMSIFDEDEDGVLSVEEFTEMMEMMMSMDEDGHDEHDDHDHGEDDMVCYDISTHTIDSSITTEEDCDAAGLMWTAANSGPGGDDDHDDDMNMTEMAEMMFAMFDTNEDGTLDESEVHTMMEMMMEEEHEEGVAFIGLHIEREGEYGIALPEDVELHVLMRGGHEGHDHGGHDDHSGHEDHDDHDEHGDDEHDDHDDHGDESHDEEELAYDPHSWLDPVAVAAQVDVVLDKLIEVFPDGEDLFKDNANDFKVELVKLDEKFASLADICSDRVVAANHNAYSYMAYRYDLDFVTVHGLDPEGEPSPADIQNVVDHINENNLEVLFIEEYTSQSSVQAIVEETGVSIQTLYTMEMAPIDDSDDYLSLMEKNFENLKAGMTCSA